MITSNISMSTIRKEKRIDFGFIIRDYKRYINFEILLIFIISIALFCLAMYLKDIIGEIIFNEVQWSFSFTHMTEEGPVIWYFEIYQDSIYYYDSFLEAFRYDGWNPYVRSEGRLDYYLYGPIFIYSLYFTSLFVSAFEPNLARELLLHKSVKWTALTYDALSVVMLYVLILCLKDFKEKKIRRHIIGLIAAFAYIFMPVNLLYIDSIHLNGSQMTFFTLVMLIFFLREKFRLSAYFLTIAFLSKQIPLFFLIPLFSILWKNHNLSFAYRKFLKPFLFSNLILAIPWIFLTPHLYIGRIFAAGRSLWYVTLTEEGIRHGVTLAHSILYLGSKFLANVYMYINIPMMPFIIFYGMALLISHFNAEKIRKDETIFIGYLTWLLLIIHVFMARGIFKYYDIFLSPFLILFSLLFINRGLRMLKIIIDKKKGTSFPDNEIIDSEDALLSSKLKIILYFAFLCISFLICIAIIYGVNWFIMITIRFMHPTILLGITFFISFFLPMDFYKSLVKKENYSILKKDIRFFFKSTWLKIVRIYRKILRKDRKNKDSEMVKEMQEF